MSADRLFEEADYSDADMLVLPGGMPGTLHLGEHKGLTELLIKFNEADKKVAAICAAPGVFGANGILKKRKEKGIDKRWAEPEFEFCPPF